MSKRTKSRGPARRQSRPPRRAPSDAAFIAVREAQLVQVLNAAGFTDPKDGMNVIEEAMRYRASAPTLVRVAEEIEDLEELSVRLDDVLDSLHGLSHKTRSRIQNLRFNPDQLLQPLSNLKLVIGRALKVLPVDKSAAGRSPYDERHTPLLAAVAMIWFEKNPDDKGVVRDGEYASKRVPEYSGQLLDFAMKILEALSVDVGSRGAVGKLLHKSSRPKPGEPSRPSLQDRIREKVKKTRVLGLR